MFALCSAMVEDCNISLVLAPILVGLLLVCTLPVPSRAAAAALTRGPYLQLLTTHSVTIVWNTDVPAGCSLAIHPLGGAITVVVGGAGSVCAIAVDGLSPGTQYGYTPNADGAPLDSESVFRTDDPSRRSFTFIAIGDSGSADANQLAVRDRMLSIAADFILHTGDMIYEDGAAADFDPKFFVPYRDIIRTTMFWPCLGNHDWHTAHGQPWRDAFWTPANNPAGSENYYSFDYGNAHFVVLDSNESTDPGSPQYTFLDHELNASDAFWKLVAFHHTIYSSGFHGSNLIMQANLVPLFDRYSVDLVLMGHDHDYERTLPLRAGQVVGPGEGTVYITTGGGGKEIRPLGTNSFTAYGEAAFHVTQVTVNGQTLEADMVRVDGAVRDSVVLTKDAASSKCHADEDCDDDQPCTVDTCQADGCQHDVVTPDAVQAAVAAAPMVAACTSESLPPFVVGLLTRAAKTVERAARASAPNRAGRQMTVAARQLDALGRRAGLAADKGRLSAACAPALAAMISSAESRAQCLASRRLPVADTYIEDRNGKRNHGGAAELKVDASPKEVAYLKFDLSAVPSLRKAQLELHVTNPSPEGGAVYRIPDSGWLEGSGNDVDPTTEESPGLTWDEVDTDADKVLDAGDDSPLVPEPDEMIGKIGAVSAGETVRVNVTQALQGGPGVYTLAIMGNRSNGARFASREYPRASWRPVLRILR